MENDKYYMQAALQEAQKAFELAEVPIGAVLVDEACRELGRWRLSGLTLYVTIEPCPMCAGALVMSRVDRVVYGSTDAKAGAAESVFNIVEHPTLNHQLQVTAGVLQEECAGIMKRFFRERRAKKKSRPIDVS